MEGLIQELQQEGVLHNKYVLGAFRAIDRKDFIPETSKLEAYQNYPLSIGSGQTISQPYTVAFILDLLEPAPGQNILEVGSGSGWQTAMLAHIVGKSGHVHAMEIVPELADMTKRNVTKYPELMERVGVHDINAEHGLSEYAPFDRIIAAASAREIPQSWKQQLAIGGKMVLPVRESIYCLTKTDEDTFEKEVFPGFVFVPFVT